LNNIREFQKFDAELVKPKVILICGARRTGKTAKGFRLLENFLAKGKEVYVLGFPPVLPAEIKIVNDIEDVPNDSVLLIDEADTIYSSRRSMRKKHLTLNKILKLTGQKDITIIMIVHSTANIDINVIRQMDVLIICNLSLLQVDTDRTLIRWHLQTAKEIFKHFPEEERNSLAYIYSDDFRGMIKFSLPSFWSTQISRAFANYNMWAEI